MQPPTFFFMAASNRVSLMTLGLSATWIKASVMASCCLFARAAGNNYEFFLLMPTTSLNFNTGPTFPLSDSIIVSRIRLNQVRTSKCDTLP